MGLSIYDLMYLKDVNKGHKIIYTLSNSEEFVFKTLTRKEYEDILKLVSNDYELEDAICQRALVHPKTYDFSQSTLAGLSSKLAPTIVEASGFTDLDCVLRMYEESKDKIQLFHEQCMALIKAAMPEYTYEEMENWTWHKLMDITAKAEQVMNLKGHNIKLVNKKEEVEKQLKTQAADNRDFVQELRAKGVDPMYYFESDIQKKKEFFDIPLIGGIHWQNEGVLNDIRKQMERSSTW